MLRVQRAVSCERRSYTRPNCSPQSTSPGGRAARAESDRPSWPEKSCYELLQHALLPLLPGLLPSCFARLGPAGRSSRMTLDAPAARVRAGLRIGRASCRHGVQQADPTARTRRCDRRDGARRGDGGLCKARGGLCKARSRRAVGVLCCAAASHSRHKASRSQAIRLCTNLCARHCVGRQLRFLQCCGLDLSFLQCCSTSVRPRAARKCWGKHLRLSNMT
jgi:hypothetical protein